MLRSWKLVIRQGVVAATIVISVHHAYFIVINIKIVTLLLVQDTISMSRLGFFVDQLALFRSSIV